MKRGQWCVGLLLLCILAFASCSKDKTPEVDWGDVTPTVEATKAAEVTPTEGVTGIRLVVGAQEKEEWLETKVEEFNKAQETYFLETATVPCYCDGSERHTDGAFLEDVCRYEFDMFCFTAEQYVGCMKTLEEDITEDMVGMFVESMGETQTIYKSDEYVVTMCKDCESMDGAVAFLQYLEESTPKEAKTTFTIATDACEEWVSEKVKAFNESQNEIRIEVVAVELPETEHEVYLSTEYVQLMMEQKPDMYCFTAEHFDSCVTTMCSMDIVPFFTVMFPTQMMDYTTTYSSDEYVVMTSDFCEEPSYVAEFLEFLAE